MLAHENPFRSERLEALDFRPQGETWDDILRRLEALNFHCAIVGPKGSGKTTMLESLRNRLERAGRRTRLLRLNSERHAGKDGLLRDWLDHSEGAVMLLDGAEQLGWLGWRSVKAKARGGLIVTAHRAGLLPTLHQCRVSEDLLECLIGELDPAAAPPDCRGLFERHGGNLRLALMELYLRRAQGSIAG